MDELKELLQKNAEQIADIQKKLIRIRRYMAWQTAWSVFKFVIVVVPLVWGVILAAPHVKDLFAAYNQMAGTLKVIAPNAAVLTPADFLKNFVK